jgi:hypothetical protein
VTVDEAPAGTLVVDFTEKEYDEYLETLMPDGQSIEAEPLGARRVSPSDLEPDHGWPPPLHL